MEGFPERLKTLIDALAANPTAFSEAAGQSPNKVFGYLKGQNLPKVDVLAAIGTAFPNANLRWLLTGEGTMLVSPESRAGDYRVEYDANEGPKRAAPQGIPVVSRISAGLGGLYEIEQYAETRLSMRPEDISLPGDSPFGLVIDGDSMAPYMLPGDIVVCSPFRKFDVGDDVAVYRQGSGESTVKRVAGHEKGSRRIKLQPLNPDYEPFVTILEPGDQVAVVIALYRNLRDRKRHRFTI